MSDTFVPHKEEIMVVIEVSRKEALVIQELRQCVFGSVTVHKANGTITRVEPHLSKLVDEKNELTIPIVSQ